MITEFVFSLAKYTKFIPYFLEASILTFLLTPILGRLAKILKAVDLPAKQRRRDDKTVQQRLHKVAKPRLGGVAYILVFVVFALVFSDKSPQMSGLLIGIGLLTLLGVLDDIFELPGKIQLPVQLLAAFIVVVSGTTIPSIQVASQFINLSVWSHAISLMGYTYNFVFPADIITIVWILTLINAINWVGGIDALEETVSFIALVTLMFLGVKLGNAQVALLSVILAGGVFGFIPYNFPPSKIFSGTAGDTILGFVIAVLSIQVGGKIPTAILILIIPLLDMIWVIFGRLKRNHVKSPFDLLSISDRSHLHHRLLDSGYTEKQVLFLESTAVAILSTFAFYLSNLRKLLILGVLISAAFIAFSLVNVAIKVRAKKKKEKQKNLPPQPPVDQPTPESKYAY